MILKKIELRNFRNYEKLLARFHKGINIIYGDNAQGKTNLLESIYVLGLTKSHRSFIDNNLIKENNEHLHIKGTISGNVLDKDLQITIDNKSKNLIIDSTPIKKVSDYISNMNIIIFYPDDLELLKGPPQLRRKYINLELSQLYNTYYIVQNDYNRLLKIRNEYLKDLFKGKKVDMNYFDIITSYLVEKAIIIYQMRYKYIEKINEKCNEIYKDIMGLEGFHVEYVPNQIILDIKNENIKNELIKQYEDKFEYDKRMCTTTLGPHKDDFNFMLGDNNLKFYGSQGQQRIAVLSLKLSEIPIFKKYKETSPILLLDDVFSELSDDKKNNLIKYISKDIQTIITTTELSNLDSKLIKKAKLFKIENGKLIKIKEVKENE
jgi:recF protein